MEQLRPNDKRARIAIIMIWVTAGLQAVGYVSDFFQLVLLKSILNGNSYDMSTLEANDMRQQFLAILNFVVLIVAGVTYIQWFRRAYYSLHLLDRQLLYSEGWAAGGWFVPILSLFRPVQIMLEMFRETQRILRSYLPDFPVRSHGTLIGWWWALWVINSLWGNVSFRISMNADNIDSLYTATNVSIWNAIVTVPLAILAVNVVKEYSGMESVLATVTKEPPTRSEAFENQ